MQQIPAVFLSGLNTHKHVGSHSKPRQQRHLDRQRRRKVTVLHNGAHTVLVGGHHYAAAYLDGLQPATWYDYLLDISDGDDTALTDYGLCRG